MMTSLSFGKLVDVKNDIIIGFASDLQIDPKRIQNFYRQNWKRQIALSDPRFYDWQFIKAPAGKDQDHCVVALAGTEIAGVMGANPRMFDLNRSERRGAELTTWIVSDQYRGLKIGSTIIDFLQSHYDVLLGAGITAAALPLYLKAGFQYLRALPRLIRVYHPERIALCLKLDKLGDDLIALRRNWVQTPVLPYKELRPEIDQIDKIYSSISSRYHLFSRNGMNWHWRYSDHPYFLYESYLLQNESGQVLLSVRVDTLPNDAKVLRIMDVLGDECMTSSVLDFIDKLASRKCIAIADFFCTASPLLGAFRAGGWFSILDEDCVQFPHLFSPIEMRDPPTTSLILWSSDQKALLMDFSKLYVSKGDVDLDRPTMEDIHQYVS
ncbi:MAG: N-acetyltransferase [Proteobacteria bacterium]|nr:N-acetyltransferase [Pseudomonadota bacterium]